MRVEQFKADMLNAVATERVPDRVVLLSITAVSCASGKLVFAPVPPEVVAQELDPSHVVLVPTL